MNRNLRDEELPRKQEGGDKFPTSSRLWSGLQNPRIVRVSKLFGGKDRHSKVSTVRGLRDRRVRLSVPTAIQLYDLQDRLGLSQPSKVVDWLLNAAQHEIDKLPPLEMPQENYIQSPQLSISFKATQSQASSHPSTFESSEYLCGNGDSLLSLSSMKTNEDMYNNAAAVGDVGTLLKSTHWNLEAPQRSKPREEMSEPSIVKDNIVEDDHEVENQGVGIHGVQVLAHSPSSRIADSSISSLLSNSMAYASYYHFDPSNVYVPHSASHSSEAEGTNIYSSTSTSMMPGSHLLLSSSSAVPSIIPSYRTASLELGKRQFDHFHMVSSSASQNLSLNSLRQAPQFGSSTMSFFQSNLSSNQHPTQNQPGK